MARSSNEVIADFRNRGISIADWSRKNKVSAALVYQVLKSSHIPARGQSHKIAVLLGLKNGVITSEGE